MAPLFRQAIPRMKTPLCERVLFPSCLETQNAAAEIRLRAERKAGSILNKMEKAKPPGKKIGNTMLPNSLENFGITKMQSSRWQLSSKVSESEFVRIVAECSQDSKDVRNKRIFELWMACYENTEIASVCGCDEKTVRTVIGESAELPKLRKDEQASAEHATDFEVPIYNIWKQQTKSTAKTDSAFAPCRVPMAGLDECCRLACDAS